MFFLRVGRGTEFGVRGLIRVDWVGIVLLSSSITGILFGLVPAFPEDGERGFDFPFPAFLDDDEEGHAETSEGSEAMAAE